MTHDEFLQTLLTPTEEVANSLLADATEEYKQAEEELEKAKDLVINAAKGQSIQGYGVIVTVEVVTEVDYDAVIQSLAKEYGVSQERLAALYDANQPD